MSYRYNTMGRWGRMIYRKLLPSVPSQYTLGEVDDICAVRLVPREKLESYFTHCINLLRQVRGNDVGDYLEFGVFNGTSLGDAYLTAKKLHAPMRFFGFDAFEGLPPESEQEDAGVWKKGFYTCSFDQLQVCLKRKDIDPNDIHWVKGWYKETLTPALAVQQQINPGIVFIDCDTYSSSKSALDFLTPLIKKPVIISLDDWRLYDLDLKGEGEYRSFNEFLEANSHFETKEIGTYKRNARSFLITPKEIKGTRYL